MDPNLPTSPAHADPAPDYTLELDTAIRLARESGGTVRTFYEVPPTIRWKDPTEPVTEADRAVNSYLVKQFSQIFPDDGMLAEESKDDFSRLNHERVWIVDPLDGTAEFIAHNGEFVIMIGLAVQGVPVVGVVYQPIDNILYAAALGKGAFVEEFGDRYPLRVSDEAALEKFRLVVSRSHRPPLVDTMISRLGLQRERSIGSVGLKIGLIARGQAEFYVHPNPGTKEWDTCAPDIIVREAGGMMTDCWNRPLQYNQRDVLRRYGVLASNGTQHVALADVVEQVLDEAGVDPDFGF
ncbi:MAG: 3'(2'),5'-bisphosphate nucleotidase CysQ family protein [Nitrospira sp.]